MMLNALRVDSERQEGAQEKSEMRREHEFEPAQTIEGILSAHISLDVGPLNREGGKTLVVRDGVTNTAL